MSRKKAVPIVIVCAALAALAVSFAVYFTGEKEPIPANLTTVKVLDWAPRSEVEACDTLYRNHLGEEWGWRNAEAIDLSQQEGYYRATVTQDLGGLFQVRLIAYFSDPEHQNCLLVCLAPDVPDDLPVQISPISVVQAPMDEGGTSLLARYTVSAERADLSREEIARFRGLTLDGAPCFQESEFGFSATLDVEFHISADSPA